MPLAGPPLNSRVDISNLLAPTLAAKPDEVALLSATSRWTWRELDQASTRLAAHLIGIGLKLVIAWHP